MSVTSSLRLELQLKIDAQTINGRKYERENEENEQESHHFVNGERQANSLVHSSHSLEHSKEQRSSSINAENNCKQSRNNDNNNYVDTNNERIVSNKTGEEANSKISSFHHHHHNHEEQEQKCQQQQEEYSKLTNINDNSNNKVSNSNTTSKDTVINGKELVREPLRTSSVEEQMVKNVEISLNTERTKLVIPTLQIPNVLSTSPSTSMSRGKNMNTDYVESAYKNNVNYANANEKANNEIITTSNNNIQSLNKELSDEVKSLRKVAIRQLRRLFGPLVMRRVLRARRHRKYEAFALKHFYTVHDVSYILCIYSSLSSSRAAKMEDTNTTTTNNSLYNLTPPSLLTSSHITRTQRHLPQALSESFLSECPRDFCESLACMAIFTPVRRSWWVVYPHESHLSAGIVVLLNGTLREVEVYTGKSNKSHGVTGQNTTITTSSEHGNTENNEHGSDRPTNINNEGKNDGNIKNMMNKQTTHKTSTVEVSNPRRRYKVIREHTAPAVLCVNAVLSEDCNDSGYVVSAKANAYVAIIPSREFWQSVQAYVMESANGQALLSFLRTQALPLRVELLRHVYFPTSILWNRSWMWPMLSGSDRVKLTRSMTLCVLNINDVLFYEGDIHPYVYLVRRGKLTVMVNDQPVATLESGVAFGEVSALFSDPRSCTVMASSICELYALHARELHKRLNRFPALAHDLVQNALNRRLDWLNKNRNYYDDNNDDKITDTNKTENSHVYNSINSNGNNDQDGGTKRSGLELPSLLALVPCFTHTSERMRYAISECAQSYTLPANHVLASTDMECNALLVLGRGYVQVNKTGQLQSASNELQASESASTSGVTVTPERRKRHHPHQISIISQTGINTNTTRKNEHTRHSLKSNASDNMTAVVCKSEIRGPGSYFGEYCLCPHTWPVNLVTSSSIDVWVISREDIKSVLSAHGVYMQAEEVCRQGLNLMRAQRGMGALASPLTAWHDSSRNKTQSETDVHTMSENKITQSLSSYESKPRPVSLTTSPKTSTLSRNGEIHQNNYRSSNNSSSSKPKKQIAREAVMSTFSKSNKINSARNQNATSLTQEEKKLSRASVTSNSSVNASRTLFNKLSSTFDWSKYVQERFRQVIEEGNVTIVFHYGENNKNNTYKSNSASLQVISASAISSPSTLPSSMLSKRVSESTSALISAKITEPPNNYNQLQHDDKFDIAVEKAMQSKVRSFMRLPAKHPPSCIDVDFPDVVEELQSIIVQHVLLTPVIAQPNFLRQLNERNVMFASDQTDERATTNISDVHKLSHALVETMTQQTNKLSTTNNNGLSIYGQNAHGNFNSTTVENNNDSVSPAMELNSPRVSSATLAALKMNNYEGNAATTIPTKNNINNNNNSSIRFARSVSENSSFGMNTPRQVSGRESQQLSLAPKELTHMPVLVLAPVKELEQLPGEEEEEEEETEKDVKGNVDALMQTENTNHNEENRIQVNDNYKNDKNVPENERQDAISSSSKNCNTTVHSDSVETKKENNKSVPLSSQRNSSNNETNAESNTNTYLTRANVHDKGNDDVDNNYESNNEDATQNDVFSLEASYDNDSLLWPGGLFGVHAERRISLHKNTSESNIAPHLLGNKTNKPNPESGSDYEYCYDEYENLASSRSQCSIAAARPPSGTGQNPFARSPSVRSQSRISTNSPRATSILSAAISSSAATLEVPIPRALSVDFSSSPKHNLERSTSTLDRYVRLDDQDYFNNFVKVEAIPDESMVLSIASPHSDNDEYDTSDLNVGLTRSSGLVLVLVHLMQCTHLPPHMMDKYKRPLVKVCVGNRVLLRTKVLSDKINPQWSLDDASFITLLRRDTRLRFIVCDAAKEEEAILGCTLETAEFNENGGVGRWTMALRKPSKTKHHSVNKDERQKDKRNTNKQEEEEEKEGEEMMTKAKIYKRNNTEATESLTNTNTSTTTKSIARRLLDGNENAKESTHSKKVQNHGSKPRRSFLSQSSLSFSSSVSSSELLPLPLSSMTTSSRSTSITSQDKETNKKLKVKEEHDGKVLKWKPHIVVTLMAVTASKYTLLHQKLHGMNNTLQQTGKANTTNDIPGSTLGNINGSNLVNGNTTIEKAAVCNRGKLWVQILAVHGLEHRIEAAITVKLHLDNKCVELMETPTVLPKTVEPTWDAAMSMFIVESDGGVLSFELYHKTSIIATCECVVDELLFTGVGIRTLPMLFAATGKEVICTLHLAVLKASIPRVKEDTRVSTCLFLHIEELTLTVQEEREMEPDPFIVVRDATTQMVLMRTPLSYSTYTVSWSSSETSCFIQCQSPNLSVATRRKVILQVCDNDEKSVIGQAVVVISTNGIGSATRYELSLTPEKTGSVKLNAVCLPVNELTYDLPQLRNRSATQCGGNNIYSIVNKMNSSPTKSQLIAIASSHYQSGRPLETQSSQEALGSLTRSAQWGTDTASSNGLKHESFKRLRANRLLLLNVMVVFSHAASMAFAPSEQFQNHVLVTMTCGDQTTPLLRARVPSLAFTPEISNSVNNGNNYYKKSNYSSNNNAIETESMIRNSNCSNLWLGTSVKCDERSCEERGVEACPYVSRGVSVLLAVWGNEREMLHFKVYDGVADESDCLGEAHIVLCELCRTGLHELDLETSSSLTSNGLHALSAHDTSKSCFNSKDSGNNVIGGNSVDRVDKYNHYSNFYTLNQFKNKNTMSMVSTSMNSVLYNTHGIIDIIHNNLDRLLIRSFYGKMNCQVLPPWLSPRSVSHSDYGNETDHNGFAIVDNLFSDEVNLFEQSQSSLVNLSHTASVPNECAESVESASLEQHEMKLVNTHGNPVRESEPSNNNNAWLKQTVAPTLQSSHCLSIYSIRTTRIRVGLTTCNHLQLVNIAKKVQITLSTYENTFTLSSSRLHVFGSTVEWDVASVNMEIELDALQEAALMIKLSVFAEIDDNDNERNNNNHEDVNDDDNNKEQVTKTQLLIQNGVTNGNLDKDFNVCNTTKGVNTNENNDNNLPIARSDVTQVDNENKTYNSATNTLTTDATTTADVINTTTDTNVVYENPLLFAGSGEVPFATFQSIAVGELAVYTATVNAETEWRHNSFSLSGTHRMSFVDSVNADTIPSLILQQQQQQQQQQSGRPPTSPSRSFRNRDTLAKPTVSVFIENLDDEDEE